MRSIRTEPHDHGAEGDERIRTAGGFVCGPSSLHPYECGAGCPHCDRSNTETHDPRTCELCDPDYDGMPNRFRRRRKKQEAKG